MRDKKTIVQCLDWPLITLYIILLALGWASVCGASFDFDQEATSPLWRTFLDFSTRSGMQIVWIATSLLLATLILCIDETLWAAFAYLIWLAFMLLLLLTPFLAHDIKGSLSWIKIGTFSIQPAEFAKFATALCIAKYINRRGFSMSRSRDFAISWAIILIPMALIILQRETGSAILYAAFFVMLYREGMPGAILFSALAAVAYFVVGVRFADTPLFGIKSVDGGAFGVLTMVYFFSLALLAAYEKPPTHTPRLTWTGLALLAASLYVARYIIPFPAHIVPLLMSLALMGYLLWLAAKRKRWAPLLVALFALGSVGFHLSVDKVMDDVLEAHQTQRIRVLLGMEDDPRGAGYNVIQAKIAIGSGGLRGKGFLNGTQTKLRYVPEQDTDFIFCTVGEEEGFVGAATVLLLFLALILRLIALAERQSTRMGRVYGYCVASILLFHLFVNVGMVLGLTPVIGIPLPFFSYGGSSLWGFTLLLFIFLRMAAAEKRLQRPKQVG